MSKKEAELRQVTEQLNNLRGEHETLKTEHQQLANDKTVVTEQLRAEQDLCAETEEVMVSSQVHKIQNCFSVYHLIDFSFSLLKMFADQ